VNRPADPDDWFGGAPDGASTEEGRGPSAFEDWLREDEAAKPGRWPHGLDKRVLIGAAVAIVALIAVLAAAGVFSSSSNQSTPPPATTATTTAQTTPAQTTPVPTVPAPKTPVKPGDTGPQVKALQRALTSLGYSTGGVDGQYGAKTEAAVKQFQSAHGLTADGVAGTKTLQAIGTALQSNG
jgi:putative peptidoglycan binding protein